MEIFTKKELLEHILEKDFSKIEDEEVTDLLINKTVTQNVNHMHKTTLTTGDKLADMLATFVGSWKFIIIFISFLFGWITTNIIFLFHPFDPFPFILLNLILSCIAALQAPAIMMSQNRQEEKDRIRAQNDYKVNLKSELILEDLHQKLDTLILNHEKIFIQLNKMKDEVLDISHQAKNDNISHLPE